ncbi:hypothetical protein [Pseudomonas putida]|uniref:hypothetical protein n=1 Tax=Pseudomonas putida TaxID=303 RepID=UPI00300EBFA4
MSATNHTKTNQSFGSCPNTNPPLPALSNLCTPPSLTRVMIGHHTHSPLLALYYAMSGAHLIKKLSDPSLKFDLDTTIAILNFAINTKSPSDICRTLSRIASQQEHYNFSPLIELVDSHSRTPIARTIKQSFRKTLEKGYSIYGNWNLRRNISIPQEIWEEFLMTALRWWVEEGTAPAHLAEIQLEIDLGL